MRSKEFIREMTDADIAKIRNDADARLKKDLDSQSDARIAKLKQKPKSFMAQVGDKIIGGVKGAAKGFAGGTAAIKEEASMGSTCSPTIAVSMSQQGKMPTEMIKRQKGYTNQLTKGGAVKIKKSK
jgi:hypothetical protein